MFNSTHLLTSVFALILIFSNPTPTEILDTSSLASQKQTNTLMLVDPDDDGEDDDDPRESGK